MPTYESSVSGGCSNTAVAGIVIVCLALAYLWSKRSSGMVGQFKPHISGLDQMPDSIPTIDILPKCMKCGYKMSSAPCERCLSCPQCKSEDKCGECQRGFERQISLSERSRPCIICKKKPCQCVSATGKKVEREPGPSRTGVYCEHVVFDY